MKHAVLTINKFGKVVYESRHLTAETAYEEYIENIGVVKRAIRKGEEYTIVRVNDGMIMKMETIKC